jgi:polysaccharide biosynthesis/export protein
LGEIVSSKSQKQNSNQNSSREPIEVIVKAYTKNRKPIASVVLLILVTVGMASRALCQIAPVPAPLPSESVAAGKPRQMPASTTPDTPAPKSAAIMPPIGVGDLLKVSILGAPEAEQEVRVGADGDISLHFVGGVHVAGLTVEQAQDTIAKKLVEGGFFTDPQVAVFTKEYATQGVSVMGEVHKPGVYPSLGSRRLFDVLSLAGGTTDRAGKVVTIMRRDGPQQPVIVVRSSDPAQAMESNVDVFPGDTVVVSKAGIVYVVGDVHKPSGVIMENGTMTVLQAIAVAEGANPTASLNKARLIRKTSDGHQEIPLELKKMLAAQSPDIPAQAEDIIFVPISGAKTWGRRTLETVVQTAAGVAIYRVP